VVLSAEPNEEGIQILEALRGVKQVRTEGAQMSIDVADGSAAISSIVRALDGAGLAFGAMRISQPTLDDVFLRLTGDQPER